MVLSHCVWPAPAAYVGSAGVRHVYRCWSWCYFSASIRAQWLTRIWLIPSTGESIVGLHACNTTDDQTELGSVPCMWKWHLLSLFGMHLARHKTFMDDGIDGIRCLMDWPCRHTVGLSSDMPGGWKDRLITVRNEDMRCGLKELQARIRLRRLQWFSPVGMRLMRWRKWKCREKRKPGRLRKTWRDSDAWFGHIKSGWEDDNEGYGGKSSHVRPATKGKILTINENDDE